jgi:hypothetical protein
MIGGRRDDMVARCVSSREANDVLETAPARWRLYAEYAIMSHSA